MSIVLHIGAPKTGTTAVQTALAELDRSGNALAGYGVAMPGGPLGQAHAALSVLQQGVGWRREGAAVGPELWPQLVAQVRAAGAGTVFVSSEYLCEAQPETIRRILDDLGDDVRVVLTLRPLTRILPSAWQQYLKSGHQLRYPDWLKAVLATPPKRSVTPSFWRRHDQAAVTERWAAAVGADRITVVVLDPDDRQLLFRAFDDALDLPPGTLQPGPAARQNRSMTAAEAELFRRLNSVLRTKELPWPDYAHLVRYGAILRTVEQLTPGREAAGLSTPGWARQRAQQLGRDYVTRIGALRAQGLHVVGDLEQLTGGFAVPRQATGSLPPTGSAPTTGSLPTAGSLPTTGSLSTAGSLPTAGPDPATANAPELIPVDVAVEALLGAVSRAANGTAFFADEIPDAGTDLEAGTLPGSGRRSHLGSIPLDRITTRQLGEVMAGRIYGGLGRRRRSTAATSARVARSGFARMQRVAGRRRNG